VRINNRTGRENVKRGFKFAFYSVIVHFYFFCLLGIIVKLGGSWLRIEGFSLDGYFRIICLPLLLFYAFNNRKNPDLTRGAKTILIVVFLFLFLIFAQIFLIPEEFVKQHYTSSLKYIFFFLALVCLVRGMSNTGFIEYKVLNNVLILIFFSVLIGLIYNIIHIGGFNQFEGTLLNLGSNVSSFRSGFLMLSGNEDANGMITLLPIVIFTIRRKTPLVFFTFVISAIFLLSNGTRTAQVIFILITFSFFLVTLKERPLVSSFIIILLLLTASNATSYFRTLFAKEAIFNKPIAEILAGTDKSAIGLEGNAMRRIHQIWLPVIYKTWEQSPLIGLGTGAHLLMEEEFVVTSTGPVKIGASFHNTYIYMFALGGLVGLYLYLHLIATLFFTSLKLLKVKHKEIRFKAIALIFCTGGYVIWSFISNSNTLFGWTIFILLLTLSVSIEKCATFITQTYRGL